MLHWQSLTESIAARSGAPLRILVVDDDRDSAEMLVAFLSSMGYELRAAHDGPAALAAFSAFRPDLVLLDIGLPRSNGYDIARTIRHESRGKRPVIVAITGWGQDEDKRTSADAGFDHHMVKPVDLAVLVKLIGTIQTV
ncbi:MAG: response regulator [Vicinamibacteraceae bacterium]